MSIPSSFTSLIKNLIITRIFPGNTTKPVDYVLPENPSTIGVGTFIRVSNLTETPDKTTVRLDTYNPTADIKADVLASLPPFPPIPPQVQPFPDYLALPIGLLPRDSGTYLETVYTTTTTLRKYTDFVFQIFGNNRFHEWTPHEINKPVSSLLSIGTVSTPEVMTLPMDVHSILLNKLYFLINVYGVNNNVSYWKIELQITFISGATPITIASITTQNSPTNMFFKVVMENLTNDGYISTANNHFLSLRVSSVGNPGKIKYAYTGKYFKAKAPYV